MPPLGTLDPEGWTPPPIAAPSGGGGGPTYPLESAVNIVGSVGVSAYTVTKAKLAQVAAGSGSLKVLFVGDSTKAGCYGAVGGGAQAACRPAAAASLMSTMLNRAGLPSTSESWFGDSAVTGLGGTLATYDTRVTLGSFATNASVSTLGGKAIQSIVANDTLTFQPRSLCDTFDVYYLRLAGQAAFTISRTGDTTSGSISAAGSNALMKATFTGALGMAPLVINHDATTSALNIMGIEAYNSTAPAVRVSNAAIQGSRVSDWASTSSPWSFRNAIANYAPDLTIIAPGINDWANGTTLGDSVTPGTFLGDVQLVINTAKASGEVWLDIGFPSANATTSVATQKTYVDAIRSLAAANNVLCQDMWNRFFPQESNPLLYTNAVHPNGTGLRWAAEADALLLLSMR